MLKIINRYILREFFKPFFLSLAAFIGIYIITLMSDEFIHIFLPRKIKAGVIVKYYISLLPFIIYQILPLSTLLASLFSLGKLAYSNEITALKSTGMSLYRAFSPIIIMSMIISAAAFGINDYIIPRTNMTVKKIKDEEIDKRSFEGKIKENFSFVAKGNLFFNISHFDYDAFLSRYFEADSYLFRGVEITERDATGRKILKRIIADKGKWINNKWYFYDGVYRSFNEAGELEAENNFSSFASAVTFSPDKIWEIIEYRGKKTENMSTGELREYIKLIKYCGIDTKEMLVDLFVKYSFPLASFILALIGAPLSVRGSKSGTIAGFGLSIFISFLYWGGVEIGRSLGKNGVLPPLLSAWAANLVFIAFGALLLFRAKK